MTQLVVDNVTKEFATRDRPLSVLRGCSLELAAGQNAAILGPSGSGKSTLLYIVGTLDRPTGGRVALDGVDPFSLSEPELATFRNRRLGFVFQDHHLLPQCSVLENVLIPTLADPATPASDDDKNAAAERARGLLRRVGLGERMDHRPAEISGGERQRVAIARALIHKPALLLADEPTGNLDRTTAAQIGDLLLAMQRDEGTMLLVVTHSLELAARFERRLELDDGKLKSV
ncbi:MAG: ABC transporter ATP-binding protein [Planctomycetaceae bacterium]|nr:ABC transporter ATP-binding protein [Planctomycetaceae bacterium]